MAIVVADPTHNPASEMPVAAAEPLVPGQHMHKNLLQEYTQRSGIYLPSYSTFNEGEPHVPRFRATVVVDGMTITSPNTFSHLKDAEQNVAKLALECISVKFKNEGSYYIHKDPVFCKLILNEYGVKLKIDKPTYNTIQQRGLLSTFVSTVTFDGKTYVGFTGKSKKEAEQNAACTVIDSILANSNACNAMAQIIKTKANLFAAMDCNATVGNASITSGTGTDSAHDVNTGLELVAVSNNGSVPVGSSWVPYTSPWVNTAHNNQVNYQIPSLGLPLAMNDPHSIISQKRSKRAKKKKRQGNQPKRWITCGYIEVNMRSILVENSLPSGASWSIYRRRTSGSFWHYLRCA
ncbi:Double-stranded RNA-binding protein 2 [Platanthera zijinensis]|uniref:Double-stranded RNA-binding protein 2 n=1 Tax=Platanthera zijinensis TaxID=2320716 RepID=A0AAP0FYA2_9ASPA